MLRADASGVPRFDIARMLLAAVAQRRERNPASLSAQDSFSLVSTAPGGARVSLRGGSASAFARALQALTPIGGTDLIGAIATALAVHTHERGPQAADRPFLPSPRSCGAVLILSDGALDRDFELPKFPFLGDDAWTLPFSWDTRIFSLRLDVARESAGAAPPLHPLRPSRRCLEGELPLRFASLREMCEATGGGEVAAAGRATAAELAEAICSLEPAGFVTIELPRGASPFRGGEEGEGDGGSEWYSLPLCFDAGPATRWCFLDPVAPGADAPSLPRAPFPRARLCRARGSEGAGRRADVLSCAGLAPSALRSRLAQSDVAWELRAIGECGGGLGADVLVARVHTRGGGSRSGGGARVELEFVPPASSSDELAAILPPYLARELLRRHHRRRDERARDEHEAAVAARWRQQAEPGPLLPFAERGRDPWLAYFRDNPSSPPPPPPPPSSSSSSQMALPQLAVPFAVREAGLPLYERVSEIPRWDLEGALRRMIALLDDLGEGGDLAGLGDAARSPRAAPPADPEVPSTPPLSPTVSDSSSRARAPASPSLLPPSPCASGEQVGDDRADDEVERAEQEERRHSVPVREMVSFDARLLARRVPRDPLSDEPDFGVGVYFGNPFRRGARPAANARGGVSVADEVAGEAKAQQSSGGASPSRRHRRRSRPFTLGLSASLSKRVRGAGEGGDAAPAAAAAAAASAAAPFSFSAEEEPQSADLAPWPLAASHSTAQLGAAFAAFAAENDPEALRRWFHSWTRSRGRCFAELDARLARLAGYREFVVLTLRALAEEAERMGLVRVAVAIRQRGNKPAAASAAAAAVATHV
jgi:hypothetical protein